jgi:hypothetical protein
VSSDFDPYEVLGLRAGASEKEIRAAYRERAARYHPDKHRGNPLEDLAEEKLRNINRARDMLLGDGRRTRGRSADRADDGATQPQTARPGPDLMSWLGGTIGTVVGAIFLLRFGVIILREIFVVLRALMMGVAGLLRMSPIFVIALMVALAMLAGYWLKARHRER